jgi:hypothetical protein
MDCHPERSEGSGTRMTRVIGLPSAENFGHKLPEIPCRTRSPKISGQPGKPAGNTPVKTTPEEKTKDFLLNGVLKKTTIHPL